MAGRRARAPEEADVTRPGCGGTRVGSGVTPGRDSDAMGHHHRREARDAVAGQGPSSLDTNTCSCCDAGMANTRSVIEAAAPNGRLGQRSCPGHRRHVERPGRGGGATVPLAHAPRRGAVEPHRHLGPPPGGARLHLSRRQRLQRTVVVALVAVAMGLLAAPIWGHATSLPTNPAGAGTSQRTYTVQAGDTLAGIARHLDPGADQQQVVAELRAEIGGAPLRPGTRLVLP